MTDTSHIREHMEMIGAVIVGAEGAHAGHHHFISTGLVADVESDQAWLSATAANAQTVIEE